MTSKKKNSIELLVGSILQQQQWNLGHVATTTTTTDVDGTDHHHPPGQKPYTLLIQHTQSFLGTKIGLLGD